MTEPLNALDFVRSVWDMAERGWTGEELLAVCKEELGKCKYDIVPEASWQWGERKQYSGTYAEVRRLGFLSSVATALASTGPESSPSIQRAAALLVMLDEIEGWRRELAAPRKYRKIRFPSNGILGYPSYDYWRLAQGRYDNRHPYRASECHDKFWPDEDEPKFWNLLWLLVHSSGMGSHGLYIYNQLIEFSYEIIAKGLLAAVIQNFGESQIAYNDPLRNDPTGLHETVRFCGLYATFRLAYPDFSRFEAEEALGYPNRGFVNHWVVAHTLSRIEHDWLS